MISSYRLLTGGLISNGQTAYYRFDTPRYPSSLNYSLELLTSGSVELEAKILSADGKTTLVESSGVGSIEMNHRAPGNGESYILMVNSPEFNLASENLKSPITTSFTTSVLVEAEPFFIDASELPIIDSVNNVEARQEITFFNLSKPVIFNSKAIETIIVGTKQKDVIIELQRGK